MLDREQLLQWLLGSWNCHVVYVFAHSHQTQDSNDSYNLQTYLLQGLVGLEYWKSHEPLETC